MMEEGIAFLEKKGNNLLRSPAIILIPKLKKYLKHPEYVLSYSHDKD